MGKIKEYLWDHKSTAWLMNSASYVKKYRFKEFCFNTDKSLRALGIKKDTYQTLQKYRGIHDGERCFILATGPSLTLEDVAKLKNEYTFGMNSICLLFDKLGFETTYYGIQDPYVYERLKDNLSRLSETEFFVGNRINFITPGTKDRVHYIPINYLNHSHTYKKLMAKFSDDIFLQVYDGYTITYSLMQIAAYMGFTKIYLLGNDCSYSSDPKKQHFADYGHVDPTAQDAQRRILYAYEVARRYSEEHGFEILNATRGGALETFKRVDLDKVLSE